LFCSKAKANFFTKIR